MFALTHLNPNISMHILHTVLYTFLMLLTRRICLAIEWSGDEPWPGSLCCALRQDTLLSQCSSSPRCTNGRRSNTPSRFTLRKPESSAGPMGHLGLYKGFTFFKIWLKGAQRDGQFIKSIQTRGLLRLNCMQFTEFS